MVGIPCALLAELQAVSCGYLGFRYEYGNGVAPDMAKAAALYRKACDGGDRVSCGKLHKPMYDVAAAAAAEADIAAKTRKRCDAGDRIACYAIRRGIGGAPDATASPPSGRAIAIDRFR